MAPRLHPERTIDRRPTIERITACIRHVYLLQGFQHTTTSDYMELSKYRTLQNLSSAVMQFISTEAMLFGVGLGNKVAHQCGRQDVGYQGRRVVRGQDWIWKRLCSPVIQRLQELAYYRRRGGRHWRCRGNLLTPLFLRRYFVPLASFAMRLRGIPLMRGGATRHVMYRSLAARGIHNTSDIAAKG